LAQEEGQRIYPECLPSQRVEFYSFF